MRLIALSTLLALFASAIAVTAPVDVDEPAPDAAAQQPAQPAGRDDEAPDAPRDVIVVLAGGERIEGALVAEDADVITLRIGRVNTRIKRDQIERIIPQRSSLERYREMRSLIEDTDVDRLLLLIEWLRSHELFKEAQSELEHVLSLEPTNGDAIRLKSLLMQQIKLQSQRRDGASEAGEQVRAAKRPLPGDFPMLSDEQINIIKVYEIDLNDPPKVLIERATRQSLLARSDQSTLLPTSRDGRAAFMRKDPVDILRIMFDIRARDLYGEVKIDGVPKSLRLFRDDVNATWLVNACATTRCHGGEQAGRLLLLNRWPRSEVTVFTNFLILDRFRLRDGSPLIDYASPDRSPLLQMGLSRGDSARPHPDVRGWSPVFRTRDTRRFRQAIRWIQSMHRPRPDYPITYEPPVAKGVSAAEEPATDR